MRLMRVVFTFWVGLAMVAPPQHFALAQNKAPATRAQSEWKKTHRVVIQVSQNDPAVMNMALNNAENLTKYYADMGEKVEIEFVAYGAGLSMVRSDTSPVKDRLASISRSMKNITFSGCGNTLGNQTAAEKKEINLLPEARLVPTGIGRIVELSEKGWTYVRP